MPASRQYFQPAEKKEKPASGRLLIEVIKSALKAGGAFAREQGLWDDAQHIAACSPHDLRHSRARHLVQAKVALPIVQHLLGHSSIATTGRYTRYSDLEMAQALSSV